MREITLSRRLILPAWSHILSISPGKSLSKPIPQPAFQPCGSGRCIHAAFSNRCRGYFVGIFNGAVRLLSDSPLRDDNVEVYLVIAISQ